MLLGRSMSRLCRTVMQAWTWTDLERSIENPSISEVETTQASVPIDGERNSDCSDWRYPSNSCKNECV